MKGKFISFEGSEGSGKSTQIQLLAKYLEGKKVPFELIREPGGVKISEAIRNILLDAKNKEMGDECETLLYMAARAQLVGEVIAPKLKEGKVILCDRFLDSTVAYQGYGNKVDIKLIKLIGAFATRNIEPDLTFYFDLNVSKGLSRISRDKDRIEQRPLDYHERVREGYLQLAKENKRRIKHIEVNKSREEIHAIVAGYVDELLKI